MLRVGQVSPYWLWEYNFPIDEERKNCFIICCKFLIVEEGAISTSPLVLTIPQWQISKKLIKMIGHCQGDNL